MNPNASVTVHNSCKDCEIKVNEDKITPGHQKKESIPLIVTIVNPDNKNKKIHLITEVEHKKSSACTIYGISPKNFRMEFAPDSPPNEENDTVTIADDEDWGEEAAEDEDRDEEN